MRTNGNILLILLIMLLFASAALLQLSEDNYLAHLIGKQAENLSNARKALNEGYEKLSISSIPQACYSDILLCDLTVSGVTVNYALHSDQQENRELRYLQYTLQVKTSVTSTWLRVVEEQASGRVVSWNYNS